MNGSWLTVMSASPSANPTRKNAQASTPPMSKKRNSTRIWIPTPSVWPNSSVSAVIFHAIAKPLYRFRDESLDRFSRRQPVPDLCR